MEADRLRENPQTPHQQETLQAITQGCTRLMRLLLAANNQATRRRKHKKLPSTSFNWVQAATDMHPACPNKKQNHLQNSLLRRTQFWVRKSFSKPASLKRASLVAEPPVARTVLYDIILCIEHRSSRHTLRLFNSRRRKIT